MREIINLDFGWKFHKGDIKIPLAANKTVVYESAKTERALVGPASKNYETGFYANELWETVNLPHDYVIEELPDKKYNEGLGFFDYKNAWYRKKFELNSEDLKKRLCIYFEGVATHATVYLNGILVKRSFSGYTPFLADITDVACEGENTLSVYVKTDEHEGWWYEGGGIYRHVKLIKTELLSIDLYGVYAAPKYIGEDTWQVDTEVTVRNDTPRAKRIKILGDIIDENGNYIAGESISGSVDGYSKKTIKYKFAVKSPELWSPDLPTQYTMRTRLVNGNTELDDYSVKFGFRTVVADAKKGLFINGKHYKVKGVCGHADTGLLGKAVPDNIHRYKVELIREMGANGYRTSHYPQAEALMDALDDNGFIVMNEVRRFESSEEGLAELETLVKRDRNRPGVIFWSIGNEEMHHVTEQGRKIASRMLAKIRELDKSRFVMTAINITPENATVCDELDIIGVNYCWEAYAAVHEKYPDKPVISSENSATGTTRGWYFEDFPERAYISAYDHDSSDIYKSREYTWKFISEREWMLGGYQWIAFEHRGEAMWPRLCSQSGAIDLFLQKKDAFYQNQSHWKSEPMIHLLPHWNFSGLEGRVMKVLAYTNAEEAELFLNGKSLGKVAVEKHGHAEWCVPYEKGRLEALAYMGGKEIARDVKITTGTPSRLALWLDTKDICANGEDVAVFTCAVLDAEGNEIPDASPEVRFSVNSLGRIVATGSDVSDHTPLASPIRKMRAGRISVAVKLGEYAGELELRAESYPLAAAVLKINVK